MSPNDDLGIVVWACGAFFFLYSCFYILITTSITFRLYICYEDIMKTWHEGVEGQRRPTKTHGQPTKGNAGLRKVTQGCRARDMMSRVLILFFSPISLQDSRRVRVSSSCALEYDKFMYIMYMYILVVLCSLRWMYVCSFIWMWLFRIWKFANPQP